MKLFDLSGKVVVITGGAGLLGKAFGAAICAANGILVIAEKDFEAAVSTRDSILKEYPSSVIGVVKLDITSEVSVKAALEDCIVQFGKVDALVNNAYPRNKNFGKNFFDVTYSDFCENIGMNLGGYFLTMRCFSEYFATIGSGVIVNISSIYGVVSPRFDIYEGTDMTMPVEYAAIKSGLIHITKYAAKYLSKTGVRVNCLSPGGIFDSQDNTFLKNYNAQCLSKGILDKEDMQGALVFLLSDASTYINGQNIVVDDGFSI